MISCRMPHSFSCARSSLLKFLLISAVALIVASSPAQAQNGTAPQYFFSVTGGDSSTVRTFTVDPTTGSLVIISKPSASLKPLNGAVATVNPAGTFLFIGTTNSIGNSAVSVSSIAFDGSVSELAASPFSISNPSSLPLALAVSPDGKYLYLDSQVVVNSRPITELDVFAIGSDGSLTPVNSYQVSIVPGPMYVHPTGRWVYLLLSVPNPQGASRSSAVEQFNVGPSGTLTDEGSFPTSGIDRRTVWVNRKPRGHFPFCCYERRA
jgi:hypothetical protein